MLARKKIERNALAHAAEQEDRRIKAAWAAATATRSWYIVHIAGAYVLRVRETLKRHGFETYYPMTSKAYPIPRKRLSHAQRRSTFTFKEFRREPLVRNYLLVLVDLQFDHWHGPFREAGAYGIACEGDLPCRILPADLEKLRRFEVDGAIPGETLVEKLVYGVGDQVRMLSGPFAGFTGTVDQVDEAGRLGLLFTIFGGSSLVFPEFSEFEKV